MYIVCEKEEKDLELEDGNCLKKVENVNSDEIEAEMNKYKIKDYYYFYKKINSSNLVDEWNKTTFEDINKDDVILDKNQKFVGVLVSANYVSDRTENQQKFEKSKALWKEKVDTQTIRNIEESIETSTYNNDIYHIYTLVEE